MRKFALVILDLEDKIQDRYNLDLVTEPSGLGFKLNMSTLTGDIDDTITKVSQSKNVIRLIVNQHEKPYEKATSVALWIQKYSKPENTMALEYDDGNVIRYCEGRVTGLSKTEINTNRILAQELEFTQTTPFFIKRENTITIQYSALGKSYPFTYPFSYGRTSIENNTIENKYIYDIPVIISIYGAISNPQVQLLDENGVIYNTVDFNGLVSGILRDNERIVINSAQKKIYKVDENGEIEDYRPQVNPEWDVFLMVKNGVSTINIVDGDGGTSSTDENFKLIGGWREYRL